MLAVLQSRDSVAESFRKFEDLQVDLSTSHGLPAVCCSGKCGMTRRALQPEYLPSSSTNAPQPTTNMSAIRLANARYSFLLSSLSLCWILLEARGRAVKQIDLTKR